MKFVEIRLDGFGRLVKRGFQFGDGFNLIFGLNETGKSTLQRAMVALLYGFFDQGRVKAEENELLNAFQPWETTAIYTGSLVYALTDGQMFQARREFAPKQATTLTTYPDGVDISGKFNKQSQGRLFFADKHLGMSREVFENTCYIHQAELIALENSAGAITDTLMRLSAAASTDTTATTAMAMLEETLKETVGSVRAKTKPLPQSKMQLDKLEAERSEALRKRHELTAKTIELNQAKAKVSNLEMEGEELRYLAALAKRNDLHQQLTTARAVVAEVSQAAGEMDKWAEWADFPIHLRDEVLRLNTQREQLAAECQKLQSQTEKTEAQRGSLTNDIAAIEKRLVDLDAVKDVRPEALSEVQELANQWKIARQATQTGQKRWQKAQTALEKMEQQFAGEWANLKPAADLGHAGLAQLEQEWRTVQTQMATTQEELNLAEANWGKVNMSEAQFIELGQHVQHLQTAIVPVPQPRKGCNLFAARRPGVSAALIPPEVQIYNDLQPIYVALVQSRSHVEEAQQALTRTKANIDERLGNLNGKELDENTFSQLSQKLTQYNRAEAEIEPQRKITVELQTELATARQKGEKLDSLTHRLAELAVDPSNLEVAVDTYVKQCAQKILFENEQAQLKQLRLQLQALTREIEQYQEKQKLLVEVETNLVERLTQTHIKCSTDTLETALAEFEEGVQNHQRWSEAHLAHETAIKHQQSFATVETYEKSLTEVQDKLTQLEAGRAELLQLKPDKTPQEYESQLEQTEKQLSTARTTLNDLQHFISQIANTFRHPAEINEEIGQVQARVQQLERYGRMLELACAELAQATEEFQRQFAPKLETLMSEGLNRITSGRYPDVRVDPKTLAVSMMAPELGQAVSAERLSTGTRELVYLMLRVGIARLMSRTSERLPLLLDDPLVQSDRRRQEQALAFLSSLAEETQVFLFTKDEWIKTWFEENMARFSGHKLHVLE